MITATSWVPRGYASEFPEKYELNEEEAARISAMAKLQLGEEEIAAEEELALSEVKEEEAEAAPAVDTTKISSKDDEDDELKEYDMEHYDDEPEDAEAINIFPNLKVGQFHSEENGDYIELPAPTEEEILEEKEELQIYPTDNLILAAKTEDELSTLEVYVYDDGADNENRESNLYVHHDMMLPSFPLCVEWINSRPSAINEPGNFVAVGTFDPQIEIFNLDTVDKVFPDVILGEAPESAPSAKKGKKKKKAVEQNDTRHTDAVLSLSHNKMHSSILASGSADHTVKLWDLTRGACVKSYNKLHSNKVSNVRWFNSAGAVGSFDTGSSVLATGGYDGFVKISDIRVAEDQMSTSWKIGRDIEVVEWGTVNGASVLYVGDETGVVNCIDVRNTTKPLWRLQAHDHSLTSIASSSLVPGVLMTSAMGEKAIKAWDVRKDPSMMLSRDLDVGNVFSCSFAPDMEIAGLVAVSGSKGKMKVWDALSNSTIKRAFRSEISGLKRTVKEERIVQQVDDGDDEEEEDGMEE